MKRIAVLGSTGSIGRNALAVIKSHPEEFCAMALSGYSNIKLLEQQIRSFRPKFASIGKDTRALRRMCTDRKVDHVLIAISGAAALDPLLWAIDAGKEISLANKEAIVMAGPFIMDRARDRGVKIIPIDSEQSAIWQCLGQEGCSTVKKVYLTASGGPFRGMAFKKCATSVLMTH